jgi:hypothetical protein
MPPFLPRIAISVVAIGLVAACRSPGQSTPAPEPSGSAAAGSASSVASAAPVFPIPSASVDYVVNPQTLPVYDGPTGSVEGTIRVKGPAAPPVRVDTSRCPAALDTYGKLFREGPADGTPNGTRALADAVVVAVGTPTHSAFYVPEKDPAIHLTIGTNCAYASRTIAMTYGQRLEVSNKTRLPFAPLLDVNESPAVMVAPPNENGEPVKIYPIKAGHFLLTDRMETFVREDLFVFRHPLHAVSDTSGHYRIDGVPVGKLEIGASHPTVGDSASVPVEIAAGVVLKVDLTLTFKPPPPPAKIPKSDAGEVPIWRRPNE